METELDRRIRLGRKIVGDHVAYFTKHLGCFPGDFKADATRVTEADLKLSHDIVAALRAAFPDDDIVSEEDLPGTEQRQGARGAVLLGARSHRRHEQLRARPPALRDFARAFLKTACRRMDSSTDNARRRLVQGGPGKGVFDGCNAAPTPVTDAPFDHNSPVSFHFPMKEPHFSVATDFSPKTESHSLFPQLRAEPDLQRARHPRWFGRSQHEDLGCRGGLRAARGGRPAHRLFRRTAVPAAPVRTGSDETRLRVPGPRGILTARSGSMARVSQPGGKQGAENVGTSERPRGYES